MASLEKLDILLQHLKEKTVYSAGYPSNFNYSAAPYIDMADFLAFFINIAGDPFISKPSTAYAKDIEVDVLQYFADLYHMDQWWGYITTGSTEGNLAGLLRAREIFPNGILYSSDSSHYSIDKAARILKLPQIIISSTVTGAMNIEELECSIISNRNRPIIINVNLGTTMKGACDDLHAIVQIVRQYSEKYYIHCDAALSGMLLPFFADAPQIDFSLYPIDSIVVSAYKFIGLPFVAGILLCSDRKKKTVQYKTIEYIAGVDTTIAGSRSGLAAVLLYYAIALRKDQFSQEAISCLNQARYLYDGLRKVNSSEVFLNPWSITVLFRRPDQEIVNKWNLASEKGFSHAVTMQHVTPEKVQDMLYDLSSFYLRAY